MRMRSRRDEARVKILKDLLSQWDEAILHVEQYPMVVVLPSSKMPDLVERIEGGLVLADALEEHGFKRIANMLRNHSSFFLKAIQEWRRSRMAPITGDPIGLTPRKKSWRTRIVSYVNQALKEIEEPKRIVWWTVKTGKAYAPILTTPMVLAPSLRGQEGQDFILGYPLVGPRKDRLTRVHHSLVTDSPPKGILGGGVAIERGGARYLRR